jgi:hypothetical protein
VSAPAIGLIVAGSVSAAFTLLTLLIFALMGTAAVSDPEVRDALPGLGVLIGYCVVVLALDALTIFAGWQMRKVQSWGVCVAGSIVAMLPCSACCILGLPLGIWALIVLMSDEVKRAFSGEGPTGGYGRPGGYTQPPGGYTPPPGGYSPPPPGGYGGPPDRG